MGMEGHQKGASQPMEYDYNSSTKRKKERGSSFPRTITSTLPPSLSLPLTLPADVTYVATNLPVSSVSRISIRTERWVDL